MNRLLYIQRMMKLLVLAAPLLFSSCSDLLENDNEFFHVATQEQQWNSLTDTRSAMFGVYGLMRTALGENNTFWATGDLRMGDFTVRIRSDLQAIRDNKLDSPFENIKKISDWTRFYKVINAACLFIEKAKEVVEKDPAYSEVNYTYDAAQVRVIRALAYFYMVRMWGDVPLITYSYDNGSFPKVARTDAGIVLNYVISELREAAKLLPEQLGATSDKYYGFDANTWRGVLLNRYSAYTILAHVEAWRGNYIDADIYSAQVLDKVPDFIKTIEVLTTTSNLVSSKGIFYDDYNADYRAARLVSFNYKYTSNQINEVGTDGHLESWTLAEPIVRKQLPDIYLSKDTLVNMFMSGYTSDNRFGLNDLTTPVAYYENYITGLSLEYPIFSKIQVVTGSENGSHNLGVYSSSIIFSRLADMQLLRAEALVILNRVSDTLSLLNELRDMRNLPSLSYAKNLDSDPKKLLKEIFQERRRELIGEGHRWYDRIREARIVGDDWEMMTLINNGGIYWPVSENVMRENPAIEQNDYWKR